MAAQIQVCAELLDPACTNGKIRHSTLFPTRDLDVTEQLKAFRQFSKDEPDVILVATSGAAPDGSTRALV
jgi:hypothetical protein